ncbi:hypothetical protein BMS3Abin07_00747 [bacterium BMS3Abin07]|nr:hypothetical protein BMS3Abin07_00747 [bacterium BMS3Abin07]GBE32965.1 hypothetical protein BMS3Bbin05_01896 [bacterium BMS3Bbin05]
MDPCVERLFVKHTLTWGGTIPVPVGVGRSLRNVVGSDERTDADSMMSLLHRKINRAGGFEGWLG